MPDCNILFDDFPMDDPPDFPLYDHSLDDLPLDDWEDFSDSVFLFDKD